MPRIVHEHAFAYPMGGRGPKMSECRCGAQIRPRYDRGTTISPSFALVRRGDKMPVDLSGQRKETA